MTSKLTTYQIKDAARAVEKVAQIDNALLGLVSRFRAADLDSVGKVITSQIGERIMSEIPADRLAHIVIRGIATALLADRQEIIETNGDLVEFPEAPNISQVTGVGS